MCEEENLDNYTQIGGVIRIQERVGEYRREALA